MLKSEYASGAPVDVSGGRSPAGGSVGGVVGGVSGGYAAGGAAGDSPSGGVVILNNSYCIFIHCYSSLRGFPGLYPGADLDHLLKLL